MRGSILKVVSQRISPFFFVKMAKFFEWGPYVRCGFSTCFHAPHISTSFWFPNQPSFERIRQHSEKGSHNVPLFCISTVASFETPYPGPFLWVLCRVPLALGRFLCLWGQRCPGFIRTLSPKGGGTDELLLNTVVETSFQMVLPPENYFPRYELPLSAVLLL